MISFQIEQIQNVDGFVSVNKIQELLKENLNVRKWEFIKRIDQQIYTAITKDEGSIDITNIVEHASPYIIDLIFDYYKQSEFRTDKIERKIKWDMTVVV